MLINFSNWFFVWHWLFSLSNIWDQELQLFIECRAFFLYGWLPTFRISYLFSFLKKNNIKYDYNFFLHFQIVILCFKTLLFCLYYRYLGPEIRFADLEFDVHVTILSSRIGGTTVFRNAWSRQESVTEKSRTTLQNNFQNCVGTLSRKHIWDKCPRNTGSQYFNYKKYFLVVLLPVADATYCLSYLLILALLVVKETYPLSKSQPLVKG